MAKRTYVVRESDFLTYLEMRLGLDREAVLADPKNADLFKARPDPDQLRAGDILHLEEGQRPQLTVRKEQVNRFKVTVPMTDLEVVLQDSAGPLKNEPYRIDAPIAEERREGTTDGAGRVLIKVPITIREVQITLTERHHTVRVAIGAMDPVGTDSGIAKRLESAGYHHTGQDLERSRLRFQLAKGVDSEGELDALKTICE